MSLKKDSTDESFIYQSQTQQTTDDSFVYKSTGRHQNDAVTFMNEDEESTESNVEVENKLNAEIFEGSRNATSRRRQFARARSATIG